MKPLHVIETATILMVDDEPMNLRLLHRFLERAGYAGVHSTSDPVEVLRLYRRLNPDLLLLDLKMPVMDGFEVLEQLSLERTSGEYLPIIVLTADPSPEARQRALSSGATDFLTKPFNSSEVLLRIRNSLLTRRMHLQLRARNESLESRVMEQARELERSSADLLQRLAQAIEARDFETGRHTQRVGENAALLGGAIDLPAEQIDLLRKAAPLHDVGKVAIPDAILLKQGPLTADEFEIVKNHTTIGAEMLANASSPLIRLAEEIAHNHHERWAGGGYPRGLTGEQIPLAARIVAIVDFFDALAHDRPYRPRWDRERVMSMIRQEAGNQFEPRLVEAFTAIVEQDEVVM